MFPSLGVHRAFAAPPSHEEWYTSRRYPALWSLFFLRICASVTRSVSLSMWRGWLHHLNRLHSLLRDILGVMHYLAANRPARVPFAGFSPFSHPKLFSSAFGSVTSSTIWVSFACMDLLLRLLRIVIASIAPRKAMRSLCGNANLFGCQFQFQLC